MSDADTRQKAEDIYFTALDLMADGKLEEAVVAYRESLAVDPSAEENVRCSFKDAGEASVDCGEL